MSRFFRHNNTTIKIGDSLRSLKPASIIYSPLINQSNFKHQYYDLTTKKSVFNSDYYNNYAQMYFHYQTRDTIHFLDSHLYKKKEIFPFKVLDPQISLQFFAPSNFSHKEQTSKLKQRLEENKFGRLKDLDFFELVTSSIFYELKGNHKEKEYCQLLTSMIISAYESLSWRLPQVNNIDNHLINDNSIYKRAIHFSNDKVPCTPKTEPLVK